MPEASVERALLTKVEEQGQLMAALGRGMLSLQAQVEIANERLEQVIVLLTPEEKEAALGPNLGQVLAELAAKVERQTVMLRDMTSTIVTSLTELPQAIADALSDEASHSA